MVYRGAPADIIRDHNASPQQQVTPSHDPALNVAHEHHHGHLHHDAYSEEGQDDEIVYSKGTTLEKSGIPDQDPQDQVLHRRHHLDDKKGSNRISDVENANISSALTEEKDPRSHAFSVFYAKYRIFFHLFIWLFFTG